MSTTTAGTAAAAGVDAPAAAPVRVTKVRFGMRGKMLSAFAVAFTIVFGLLALFIMAFVTDQAQTKLTLQLRQTAAGGAATLDGTSLTTLLAKHPTYNANDKWLCAGLTGTACAAKQDELYKAMNKELADIRTLVPNSSPYTYFRDAADGKLKWLTSWSALNPDPNFTVPFRGLVSDVVNAETAGYMDQGLTGAIDQPQYQDSNGKWISTYVPVKDAAGKTVAALGVDYPLSYVDEVRSNALRNILPLLLISYILLMLLVLLVATWLTRPLTRLTAATQRIADGDYDVDLANVVRTRIPDEMVVLSHSFARMVDKVRAREKKLTREVKRLTVEIDSKKREQAVNEITDSDFFAAIAAKASSMRQRMDDIKKIDEPASRP